MSNRTGKTESSRVSRRGNKKAAARRKKKGQDPVVDDRQLVDRCLAGDVVAWEELYERCHPALLVSIQILLGRSAFDRDLVDELAACVWYALVANDGELLARYDPERGAQLPTFMRALAKDEVSRHFRTERRRRERELTALREKPRYHVSDLNQPITSISAFLATLTPHERGFCSDYLLSTPSESGTQEPQTASANVAYQLTYRIHQKLQKFLDPDS